MSKRKPKERSPVALGMILTGKGQHSRSRERLDQKSRDAVKKQERKKVEE